MENILDQNPKCLASHPPPLGWSAGQEVRAHPGTGRGQSQISHATLGNLSCTCLKSFWKQETWGPGWLAEGLGSFNMISAGTFSPETSRLEAGSESRGMVGLDTPTEPDFLGAHTAQQVLVLLPKVNSLQGCGHPTLFNSRGTSCLCPSWTPAVLGNSWGTWASRSFSTLTASSKSAPSVEATQHPRKPTLAYFVSDGGNKSYLQAPIASVPIPVHVPSALKHVPWELARLSPARTLCLCLGAFTKVCPACKQFSASGWWEVVHEYPSFAGAIQGHSLQSPRIPLQNGALVVHSGNLLSDMSCIILIAFSVSRPHFCQCFLSSPPK